MKVSPAELVLYDAKDSITIRPFQASATDEVICKTWNLGAPEIRATATERPGADGVDEGPAFLGARTVTLELVLMGANVYTTLNRLLGFTHPSRAPYLRVRRAAGPTAGQSWSLRMRGLPYAIEYGRRAAALLELTLSFSVPDGYLTGPLKTYSTSQATGVQATEWKFPAKFPKTFGAGTAVYPTITIQVEGNAPVAPAIYITGPATDPEVRTDDGERFKFSGLTIVAGQTVQIDMASGNVRIADTATLAVNDDGSLFGSVDLSVSSFWRWNPGVHVFRYRATSGSATVQFRERRLNP